MSTFTEIQELLQQKADCHARLQLIPYDGSPEIKESGDNKYLYVRKRVGSRLTSTYVDIYSEELHQLLLKNAKEARDLRKKIRAIDKKLNALEYEGSDLSARVLQNLDFARANMKANIYDQAVLEGIATSFNEGITQLFSCLIYSGELGVDNFHKFNNTYEEQARVISQLSLMISPKEIKNAYFHNLGIGYINDKLKQIDKRKVLYCGLSTNMGRLISDKLGDNAKNVSIVKIQCILLQYEKRYLEMSDKVKNKEFIDNINYYYIGYWNDIDNMNFSDETKDLIVRNLNNFYSLYEIEKEKTYTK